ncbi:hypothetical protein CCZ20_24590 [Priestia aryabhattai]|uniref:hypothetical protein n=1 Tax=Priestia aryabhattai TaxID=412384 RepID=UPI000B513D35|nr:hypothetical protein [Priestia aryabhattai]OVE34832.1 hypothetical protein CCZ20_24590 [Priestia aryabhattai]
MSKELCAMVLDNDKEVIVIQGDKETILSLQKLYNMDEYGMTLITGIDKEVAVKHIKIGEGSIQSNEVKH